MPKEREVYLLLILTGPKMELEEEGDEERVTFVDRRRGTGLILFDNFVKPKRREEARNFDII